MKQCFIHTYKELFTYTDSLAAIFTRHKIMGAFNEIYPLLALRQHLPN